MSSLREPESIDATQSLLEVLRAVADSGNSEWRTLPPKAYYSPELFELEKEHIFRAHWLCIGRADQVPNPGDFMALDVVGEPVVLLRDLQGDLRVLSNVCRHRWMKICAGSGNTRGLACPYHAWTYELDGKLRAAVEMSDSPGFDPRGVALPAIRHEVWQGFVYINLDGNAGPLCPQLTHIDTEIAEFELETWEVARTIEFDEYPWDWKVMQDNGECFHHVGAHNKTFEPNFPARGAITRCEGSTIIQWCPAKVTRRVKGADGLDYVPLYFTPKTGLTETQRTCFILLYVLPNFFIYLQPDYGVKLRVFPTGAGKIRMLTDFLVPPFARELPDFEERLDRAVAFFNLFNDEDYAVNSAVQKGLQSSWAGPAPLSHLEAHNQHVARWIAEQLTAV